MINIFLAFVLLSVAMYLAIKVLNVINARFNLLPAPDVIKPQSNAEQIVDALADSFQVVGEIPPIHVHASNSGEIEAGAISHGVVTTAENLVEGVQALAESAGEHLTTMIEGLSHH
jgi:hypothetical protein